MGYLGNPAGADAMTRRLPEPRVASAPARKMVAPAQAVPSRSVERAEHRRRGAAAMTRSKRILSGFIAVAMLCCADLRRRFPLRTSVAAASRIDPYERRRARACRAASEGMGPAQSGSASARARELPAMASDASRRAPARCSRTSRRSAICRRKNANECSKDCASGVSFRRRGAMNCSISMRDGVVCRPISAIR